MTQPNNAAHYEPGTLEHHIAVVEDARQAGDHEGVTKALTAMYAAGFETAAAGLLQAIVGASAEAAA